MQSYTMNDCPICDAAGPHHAERGQVGCATCSNWFGSAAPSAPRQPDRYSTVVDAASRKPAGAQDLSGWLPGRPHR